MERIQAIEERINKILKDLNWDREYILNTDFESRLERKMNKRKERNLQTLKKEDENEIKMNLFPLDKSSSVIHFKINRKYGEDGENCYRIVKDIENNAEIVYVDIYDKDLNLNQYLNEIQDEIRRKRANDGSKFQ